MKVILGGVIISTGVNTLGGFGKIALPQIEN
jgi:hypothetical protein